jgi:hypothetical protein
MTKMSEKQKNSKTSIFHIVIMEVSFTRKRADNLKKNPTNNNFIALNLIRGLMTSMINKSDFLKDSLLLER